jgi:hypothetical protein
VLVRTRGLDIKAGAAKLKADKAARLEAELVIDRWNRRMATGRDMLWSPTIRAALIAGTPARRLLPGARREPRDRPAHGRSSPTRLGRDDGAGPAALLVSGGGADAEAAWLVRVAAGDGRKSLIILMDVPKMKVAGVRPGTSSFTTSSAARRGHRTTARMAREET